MTTPHHATSKKVKVMLSTAQGSKKAYGKVQESNDRVGCDVYITLRGEQIMTKQDTTR
jgi:hypothetical protein